MLICAAVLVVGSAVAYATVRALPPDCRHPECLTHASITAPPLEGERAGRRIA
jgi:hypothetical protein